MDRDLSPNKSEVAALTAPKTAAMIQKNSQIQVNMWDWLLTMRERVYTLVLALAEPLKQHESFKNDKRKHIESFFELLIRRKKLSGKWYVRTY